MNALRCLALASLTCVAAAATDEHPDNAPRSPSEQRLGVIVPAHRGDLDRAVSSLGRWPAKCSPVTQKNVDIVLYYAEGEDDTAAAAAIPKIVDSAGRCFADTRLVYANLSEEEDIYPKGPSVQFYKMFLDEDVRAQLVEYDALAIIEWDVLVATDQSFEKLYEAAFDSTEDFWVKGSNLEGTNFHVTAESNDMWHVLGHINGNAIYKNNDSGFTEFVDYTRSRWGYKYPYDVALWATISDFPYSWPLWQRFSPKFVTTNLISNVGYEHVDKGAVADAVASGSLFIHGSMVDEGSVASWQATATTRRSLRAKEDDVEELACTPACGRVGAGLPVGASTVCDATCAEGGRFDGYLCGAGSSIKFGSMCRLCFNDVEEARKAESRLNNGKHVIMCDTMRPPAAVDCSDECTIKKDTVCDEACGTGLYGDYSCNWRNLGAKCRSCFDDVEAALEADEVAKRHGGRVIMCDTHEPPNVSVDVKPIAARSRKLQPWRDNQKWKTIEKWQGNDDTEPKWKTNQKWKGDDDTEPKWKTTNKYKTNVCLDGCESDDRICDSSCKNGDPYGKLGCNTLDGLYGRYCRACYNDETEALAADSAANRAIMCATGEPVTPYATRQLRVEDSADAPHTARELQRWRENQKWKTIEKWQGNDDTEPKWKTNQKWKGDDDTEPKWKTTNKYKTNVCLDGCESDDRICDSSCKNGDPYGKLGCNTLDGLYGRYCRACYNDETEALAADSAANRAIMCATGEPVTPYATRQLRAVDNTFDPARETPSSDLEAFISVSASIPLTNGIVRGDICAFISGGMNEIEQADVTVQSILEFVPGVRVVIAAEAGSKPAYESTAGIYPSVSVFDASSARTASLFADEYCGEGTKLIFYVETGSVISRTFTSKDTHSPRGDLLVVYSDARTSYRDFEIARATSAVLGFKAPSFTHGADLMLPVGANKDLREELTMGVDSGLTDKNASALAALESHDVSSVPQLLAALAYSKSTPGVWFVNPQAWVTEHLFKTASIWEVPLVKPRFTCTINRSLYSSQTSAENAELLTKNLDFFQKGGLCENGVISANPQL